MPGFVSAHGVTKSFGAAEVLRRVSLVVAPGDRVGVIGPNGIGKSTFLRILAGLEEPDGGRIVRTGTVGYMSQEPDARPGETLLAYLARRTGVGGAAAHMDGLAARLGEEPDLAHEYTDALERFLSLGGADFEARARAVAADVGLARMDQAISEMSGGEAARATLAGILLARFDVFLLDEPTNNLDFEGLARLEEFLDGLRGGAVIVSHDRAFLDRTVTRVLELEAETREPHEYAGGWSEYEAARERTRAEHEKAFAAYVGERERFRDLLSDRRTQARAGGAQADRRGTHALMSKVRSAEKRLERLEVVDKPWQPWRLRLSLQARGRGGELAAELRGAVVARGPFRLGPVDVVLRYGDRLAVVGRNGSGKTTLLQALLGTVPLTAGARRVGPSTRIGELDQKRELFDTHEPLPGPFCERARVGEAEARTLLAKFGLGADELARPASSLSPGERTRAVLALLMATGVNCLVLDEPTNHLDLEAIEELERALEEFDGTLVLVTHDRRFLEKFRATRTLELAG
jgi:ATPase subunit of ABC transporter with duplicated ATPase domains